MSGFFLFCFFVHIMTVLLGEYIMIYFGDAAAAPFFWHLQVNIIEWKSHSSKLLLLFSAEIYFKTT